MQAALTGDVVNSTKLTASQEKKLTTRLNRLFAGEGYKIYFFRGDSFQAYAPDAKTALRLALLSRSAAMSLIQDQKLPGADVRISIGLGNVKKPVRTLKTAKGEAFILSGRKFDEMIKADQRLAIATANPLANEGLQVIAGYLNTLFGEMTEKQAAVVFELLKGEMQKTVARKLKKTKSTIHQHSISARWPAIEKILEQYENIIKLLT